MKVRLPRHRLIVCDTVAVERGIARPPAQRVALCQIGHDLLGKRRC